MSPSLLAAGMLSAGGLILGADAACGQATSTGSGQDYPNRPVRIVTTGAGSALDSTSRLIAQGITGRLGQPVIVDNRGGGVIPGEIVSKSPPDGYTLLVTGGTLWIGPLMQKSPYDPVRDFLPITVVSRAPNILVVHPSLPVTSVKELIALAKAKPAALNYASSGTGGTNHLAAELFKAMTGVNIVHVPYKGAGPPLTALISGEVQVLFSSAGAIAPHVKSGKMRALAVTSAQPTRLAPGLPTVAASGVVGYESVSTLGMFAPANTPAAIINRLNQEVVGYLKMTEAKEIFFNRGADAVSSSPDEFAATIKSEMARIGKVIKDAGIKAD